MGLFDIINRNARDKDLIHIKNMILVASADSVLDKNELTLITHILARMNVSETYFQRALEELQKEKKITVSGGRIVHSYNALAHIEVVAVNEFDQKLKYLQDYVLVMMSDGSIDNREKRFIESISDKMGLPPSSVDIVIRMVAQKTKGYGTASASSATNKSTQTGLSDRAKRYYNFVEQQVDYISKNFQSLTRAGMGEAKILCSALFSRLCKNLDEDTGEDFLICLLDNIEEFNHGNSEEQLEFLSSRMDFYNDEIDHFSLPTYSCMAIYNTLYVNPFTDDPYNFDDLDVDPIILMMLYRTIVNVANNINHIIGDSGL